MMVQEVVLVKVVKRDRAGRPPWGTCLTYTLWPDQESRVVQLTN